MVRKFIIWFTGILIVLSSLIPMGVSAKDSEDYKTLLQTDSRWADKPLGSGGFTIGQAGCAATSVTMLMAYANPDLRDISKWNPAETASTLAPSGMLVWGNTTTLDSTFQLVDVHWSVSDPLKTVTEAMDKGYYVIIYTPYLYDSSISSSGNQHYSPIVGVEDGKPQVWDVGVGLYNDWDIWVKCGITQIVVYKSTLNSSKDTLKGIVKNSTPEKGSDEYNNRVNAWATITKELDLLGMDSGFSIAEGLNKVELPNKDDLSKNELANIENIKLNIEENKVTVYDIARYSMVFSGLVVVLYGLLLLVAYLFDSSNTLFDISMLGVITFGKYRLWYEDLGVEKNKKESDGKIYCTLGGIIWRIAILEAVGLFIASSGIFRILLSIFIR